MALDIIEVTVNVDGDATHSSGDVLFDLTELPLPSRACKIINAFFEAESVGITDHVIRCLFFKSNNGGSLSGDGKLNVTADITADNFALNKYIGEIALISDAGATSDDPDKIDTMSILRMFSGVSEDTGGAGGGGSHPLILKGSEDTSFSHGVWVGGIHIAGGMAYTADRTAKLILHVEY